MSISLSASTSQRSHQSLSVCFAGRIDGLSSEQVLILAAVYKARPTWPERNTSSTRRVNHDWALMCENLEDSCDASLTLQNISTGNCKQRFPENLSALMCVCGKMRGRWKLSRENSFRRRRRKNTEKEEAALYIIAHCIIYKETRNNRMQCRSAVLPPEAARKVRTRSAAACERRHLHLNPVSADMFYKCVCFNVSLPVCVWSWLFHEGSLLISHWHHDTGGRLTHPKMCGYISPSLESLSYLFHQLAPFIYYNLNQFFQQIFHYFCFYLVFLSL